MNKKLRDLVQLCEEGVRMCEEHTEFMNDLKEAVIIPSARHFIKHNTDNNYDEAKFIKQFKEKHSGVVVDNGNFFLNLYWHYKEKHEPFLQYEFEPVSFSPDVPQNLLDDLHQMLSNREDKTDLYELIEETKEEYKERYEYEVGFYNIVKNIITEYIAEDHEHFTGLAFRELDYICYVFSLEVEYAMVNMKYEE